MRTKITLFPILLVGFELLAYFSNDMYLPALPQITEDLQITTHLTQLTLAAWYAGATTLQLVFGSLSDRYGRKPILLSGVLIFILATSLCALSTEISTLLTARFLQGCSVCAIGVAGYASIHELYAEKEAIQIISLLNSFSILAASFGPSIGSLILLFSDWRSIFWILMFPAIFILFALFFKMPESNPATNRTKTHFPTLFLHYKSTFLNEMFIKRTLIFCSIMSGTIIWLTMSPFLILETFGHPPIFFGGCQVLIFGCFIIGTRIVWKNMKHTSKKLFIRIGLKTVGLGAITITVFSLLLPNSLWPTIIGMMLYELGAGLSLAALQRSIVDSSLAPMGIKMAVFSTTLSFFATLSSLFVTVIYNGELTTFSYATFFVTLIAYYLFHKTF